MVQIREVADATCTACGCLCDDITLVVNIDANRIIEARRACPIGRAWFLADRDRQGRPSATVDGRAVESGEGIARAAEILGAARAPIILGLEAVPIEAQAAAVAIADRLGGVVDVGRAGDYGAVLRAIERVGIVSATLGEVRHRADVVAFWGVDPVTTHPRHFERYSVDAPGRFVGGGRTVLVADVGATATAGRADAVLRLDADRQLEALSAVRAIVRGSAIDAGRLAVPARVDAGALADWTARLTSARYGALFFGPSLGGTAQVEAALRLVRELNGPGRRFVALTLGPAGNAAGARGVMAWQSGYASTVDFASGIPRSLPGVTSAADRLSRGEVDAALLLDNPAEFDLSEPARAALARLPTVLIAPGATDPSRTFRCAVAFDAATPGIDAPGTVARSDGPMLPLRPALATDLPTALDLLEALDAALPPVKSGSP